MSFWRSFFLYVFTVGWLSPLAFGLLLADRWFAGRVFEVVEAGGGKPKFNSFEPYFFARPCFVVAFLWLALVVTYWARKLIYSAQDSDGRHG